MPTIHLPTLNAVLNTLTALLLVAGWAAIRRNNEALHKKLMLAACVSSTLFLASYLYYHAHHGATRFTGEGWVRPVYFTILITHTILAAVQLPMIITVLVFAFKGRLERHRALARLTLPIWLYVSVTGVVIYWMLYRVMYS